MSLLLDALKKAALEKKRREQPNEAGGHTSDSANQTIPSASAASIASPATPPEPVSPAAVSAAVSKVESSELAETPVDTFQSYFAPSDTETELKNVIVEEGEDESLIFNIDEIDSEYLGVQEVSVELANATQDLSVAIQTAESAKQDLESPSDVAAPSDVPPVSDLQAHPDTSKIPDPEVAKAVSTSASPGDSAEAKTFETISLAQYKATTNEQINAGAIEQFNASAGKAALSQLLVRSKNAATNARKRMLMMYALLTLTAVAVLAFYYYLLQNNASPIVQLPPRVASVVPPDAPVNAEITTPENGLPPAAAAVNTESPKAETGKAETDKVSSNLNEKSESSALQAKLKSPVNQSHNVAARPGRNTDLAATVSKPDNLRNSEVLPPEFKSTPAVITSKKPAENVVNETVARAYAAYQRGDLQAAQIAYRDALEQNPYERDALLGLAAIAVREGRQQDALGFYQQRLARDPKDQYAQSGMLALSAMGEPDPQLESELTRLLREYPDAAHLHFLQGSLLAAKRQWDAAQLAFFEAWQRDSNNPDFAFNLAVALDHLHQVKEARRFYQQALTLGNSHPGTFSKEAVDRRLKELEGDKP